MPRTQTPPLAASPQTESTTPPRFHRTASPGPFAASSLLPRLPPPRKLRRSRNRLHLSPRKHLRKQMHHLPTDQSIRRQHLAAIQRKRPTIEVRHRPPSLPRQQYARRGIPGIQIELPEPILPPASHIGAFQPRAPSPSHPMRSQRSLLVKIPIRV